MPRDTCLYRFPTLAWRTGQLRKKGAVGVKARWHSATHVPWRSQVWFRILKSLLTVAVVLLTRHRGRVTQRSNIESAAESVELA